MIGVGRYVDKAVKAVANNQAALERSTRRLSDHDTARPSGDDADELYAWKRERRDLEDRVESDQEALKSSEKRAEQARAEAAEKEHAAEHAAAERQAAVDVRIVGEVAALTAKLAAKLTELEASRSATANANQDRGTRPFIVDAEARVRRRRVPGRPAITQTIRVLVDEKGERQAQQFHDGAGMAHWRHGLRQVEVEEIVCQALPDVVETLPTLSGEIRLVDLEGRQIWPLDT